MVLSVLGFFLCVYVSVCLLFLFDGFIISLFLCKTF